MKGARFIEGIAIARKALAVIVLVAAMYPNAVLAQRPMPVAFTSNAERVPRVSKLAPVETQSSRRGIVGAVIGGLAGGILGAKLAYGEERSTGVCALASDNSCPASVNNYLRDIALGMLAGGFLGYAIATFPD